MRCETNKPPAMRVRIEGYTKKNSKRDTIKVFKPIVKQQKEKNHGHKRHIVYHTQSGTVSITLCSLLSIDEKSFIINIEVVWEKYSADYVVIKVLRLLRAI